MKYILEVLLIQGVLFVFYELYLRSLSTYQWNRAYLIGAIPFSFSIPFLKDFWTWSNSNIEVIHVELSEVLIDSTSIITNKAIDWWLLIYGIGVLISLVWFTFKIHRIIHLYYQNPREKTDGITIIRVSEPGVAFSFFHFVFLSQGNTEQFTSSVLEHEKWHVKKYHSFDLLLLEVLNIILWFNPFMRLIQKRLQELHEFQVDEKMLIKNPKDIYLKHLLNELFTVQEISFVNQFKTKNMMKKRLKMMLSSKSTRGKNVQSYTLSVFVYLCIGLYSALAQDLSMEVDSLEKEWSSISMVDEIPVFPGCEDKKDDEARKCFSKSIEKHIAENFMSKTADLEDLELTPGEKRIFVLFKIDESGAVTDIRARAPHKLLENSAIESIESLPKMQPAKKDGKAIGIKYSLPIMFNME